MIYWRDICEESYEVLETHFKVGSRKFAIREKHRHFQNMIIVRVQACKSKLLVVSFINKKLEALSKEICHDSSARKHNSFSRSGIGSTC